MTLTERGLQRGRAAGAAAQGVPQAMAEAFAQWRILYPTAADLDFAAELRRYDAQRLEDQPDLAKYPELKGHADFLRAERQGFRETSKFDDTAVAFHFSEWFYRSRRLDSRHLARWDIYVARSGCTNIFIPGGADGVTLADNRDIGLLDDMSSLAKWQPLHLLSANPDNRVAWCQGGVSAAVLLDEEPKCSFPADPGAYPHLVPEECYESIDVTIEFLTRYNEFWGPGNRIYVDRQLRAAAVEKSNCRLAWRQPTVNGAIAITACAYLDDQMSAHQLGRAARAAALQGEPVETNMDRKYHLGSRKRYRRLVDLTDAAAKGKPTIWDALDVVADHAVPYPDRVCLAGESCAAPAGHNPNENWSVTQHAAVITGPRRRAVYRSVQSRQQPKPVYDYTPKLLLWPGVPRRTEWQAEIAAGRCMLPQS